MKNLHSLLIIALAAALASCVNGQSARQIAAERDSLLLVTQQQGALQAEVDEYMETLVSTLDSIKLQGNILTLDRDENGKPLKRQQIMENLQLVGDVMERQRQRIEELDAKLAEKGKEASHYRALVKHLREEIDAKNAEITRMENELSLKNATITDLTEKVGYLQQDVESMSSRAREQEEQLAQQAEVLAQQDKMLNTAHVIVGTKKELKKAGLMGKGVLKGGQLNPEALDMGIFTDVDIRNFKEIKLSSYRPKLLTNHPSSSYQLKQEEDSDEDITYLIINDPAAFWSMSSFLVVQL